VGEEFLPLMVHQDFKDIIRVFVKDRISSETIQTSQSFSQYSHNSKVYVKAFSPYMNSDEIEHLFQLANKRGGDERSYELQKELYMMRVSPGAIVSKTNKFEEDGGILGVDFMGFTSLKMAIKTWKVNRNWGSRPNKKPLTIPILRNNVNERGVCFVLNSNGNMIPNYGKGALVKFSGYMHARTNGSDKMKGIVYRAE
jgi:hypothetical protein